MITIIFRTCTFLNGTASYRRWKNYPHYVVFIIFWSFCLVTVDIRAAPRPASRQQTAPLYVGLLPHLSSNLLLKKYQKLIVYLEGQLQRRIVVQTAPNFKTYVQRVIQGRYDLYLTAPHLAAYHELENGHQRVAGFSNPLRGVIVVAKDSPYQRLSDLHGKLVFTPDNLAAITLLGEVTLQRNSISVIVRHTPSHNNALHAVALAKADAAIAGMPAFKITNTNTKLKKPLRILSKTDAIPHMMFMVPDRISTRQRDVFKRALLNIDKDATGRAFIENVPFGKFVTISDQDMQRLTDLVTLLRQRL